MSSLGQTLKNTFWNTKRRRAARASVAVEPMESRMLLTAMTVEGVVDPSDGPQSFVLIDGRAESIQQHDWGFPGVEGGVDPSDGPQSFVLIDGRAESIQQHDWGFPGVGGVDPSDGPQVIVAEGAAWDLNRSDRQTPSAGYDLASEDGLCFPEDMLRQETAGLEVTGSCRNSDGGDSPSILGQANGKTENILIDTVGGLDVGSALGGAYVEAADSFFAGWPGSVVDPSDCPRVVYSDDGPLIMNTGLADHFVGDDDLWLTGNGEANPVDGYFAGITAEGPMEELSGSIIRRNGIENDGAQD